MREIASLHATQTNLYVGRRGYAYMYAVLFLNFNYRPRC